VAACVWGGLVLGLAVFGYLYPWSHNVFNVYALAGRSWWVGRDLYATEGDAFYRYSPLFAIGVSPFALLPGSWGNALWRIFSCAMYGAGLWSWGRRFLPGAAGRTELAAFLLLVLPTSIHSMYNAQANLVMLGAVLLGLSAAADERWNSASTWLALATLIKGYPIALALLLAALYPRRFATRFVGAMLLGLLLPFAAQWPTVVAAQYTSWWAHLRESTTLMRERLRSLDYLFVVYGRPLSPRTFLEIQVLAGVAVLAICLFYRRRVKDQRGQLLMTFLLYSTWAVLCGPATEACTYIIIAPAVAWALLDAFNRNASWWTRLGVIVSLLLMGPSATDAFGHTLRNFANEHGSQPIGALLFLSYVMAQVVRQSESSGAGAAQAPEVRLSTAA
jgi:hypothetical protein